LIVVVWTAIMFSSSWSVTWKRGEEESIYIKKDRRKEQENNIIH